MAPTINARWLHWLTRLIIDTGQVYIGLLAQAYTAMACEVVFRPAVACDVQHSWLSAQTNFLVGYTLYTG